MPCIHPLVEQAANALYAEARRLPLPTIGIHALADELWPGCVRFHAGRADQKPLVMFADEGNRVVISVPRAASDAELRVGIATGVARAGRALFPGIVKDAPVALLAAALLIPQDFMHAELEGGTDVDALARTLGIPPRIVTLRMAMVDSDRWSVIAIEVDERTDEVRIVVRNIVQISKQQF